MNCSPVSALDDLSACLTEGLKRELVLTPKPGLVDLLDSGSHPDLSLASMLASVELVGDYFRRIVAALLAGAPLSELVTAGREAEARMLSRFGTNTHKGAIFLGGLLLAARAAASGDGPEDLRGAVVTVAAELFPHHTTEGTNGETVRRAHGVSGIVGESLAGLPSLFDISLPAFRQASALRLSREQPAFLTMGRLMQTVEDTTALHRCGAAGLARLKRDGKAIETLVLEGASPVPLLLRLNEEYRRMNLTMGGVADLLGLTFGCALHLGIAPSESAVAHRICATLA